MTHCEKCIHYDVCRDEYKDKLRCSDFKNKANFAEAVRCKDCKHFTAGYCCRDIKGRSQMHYMGEEAFCSYGERKDT